MPIRSETVEEGSLPVAHSGGLKAAQTKDPTLAVVLATLALCTLWLLGCATPTVPAVSGGYRPTEAATRLATTTSSADLEAAAREHTLTDDELKMLTAFLYVVIDAHTETPSLAYGAPELTEALEAIAGNYPTYFERTATGTPLITSEADFSGRCGVDCRPHPSLFAAGLELLATDMLEQAVAGTNFVTRAHQVSAALSALRAQGIAFRTIITSMITVNEAIDFLGNVAGAFASGAAIVGASGPAVAAAVAIAAASTAYAVGYELGTVGRLVYACLGAQGRCDASIPDHGVVDAATSDAGGCGAGLQDNDGDGMCAPNCASSGLESCSDHGTCDDSSGTPLCVCFSPYSGSMCETGMADAGVDAEVDAGVDIDSGLDACGGCAPGRECLDCGTYVAANDSVWGGPRCYPTGSTCCDAKNQIVENGFLNEVDDSGFPTGHFDVACAPGSTCEASGRHVDDYPLWCRLNATTECGSFDPPVFCSDSSTCLPCDSGRGGPGVCVDSRSTWSCCYELYGYNYQCLGPASPYTTVFGTCDSSQTCASL